MNEHSRKIYNRLRAISDAQRALVKANPFPYLDRLNAENARLRAAIEEAYAILSGVNNFDYAQEIVPTVEPSLVETSIKQNTEVMKILADIVHN